MQKAVGLWLLKTLAYDTLMRYGISLFYNDFLIFADYAGTVMAAGGNG